MTKTEDDAVVTTLAWATIEARGPEAVSFLQGQLSQDVDAVGDEGAWALLLEPDSVVMTTCFVQRRDDGVDLIVPHELAEVALTRLKRFLLRMKCTLEIGACDVGPFATLDEQISANWPGPNEFAASLTPHTFGRSFVASTISFQKGCFTGQELVGRLDARGSSVPWRFVRVSATSRELANEYLKSKGPAAGPQGVTSARLHDGRFEGLGIAHRTLLGVDEQNNIDVTIEEID